MTEKKMLLIWTDADLHLRLKLHCVSTGISIRSFTETLIREELTRLGSPPPLPQVATDFSQVGYAAAENAHEEK